MRHPPFAPEQSARPDTHKGSHFRLLAILGSLIVIFELWIWVFFASGGLRGGPSGNNWGGDFAMYYAASRVLESGGNPYDHRLLIRVEATILRQQGISTSTSPRLVRVGNPPLAFWMIRPISHLPFRLAGSVWLILMYLCSAGGLFALLSYLGWKHRVAPCLLFLLSPPVFHGAGNSDGVIFASVCMSLLLAARQPYAAGALLAVSWSKPQLMPLALVVVLCQSPRAKLATGFLVATGALFVITIGEVGLSSLGFWIQGMLGYTRGMAGQPAISSIAGAYIYWAPESVQKVLDALCVATGLAISALWWVKSRPETRTVAAGSWLWILWLLTTPYAHFSDEIFATLPILVLVGRDGKNLLRWTSISCLYLLAFSMALAATSFLWLPLAVIGVICVLGQLYRPLSNQAQALTVFA